jgi:hypothetical protein
MRFSCVVQILQVLFHCGNVMNNLKVAILCSVQIPKFYLAVTLHWLFLVFLCWDYCNFHKRLNATHVQPYIPSCPSLMPSFFVCTVL